MVSHSRRESHVLEPGVSLRNMASLRQRKGATRFLGDALNSRQRRFAPNSAFHDPRRAFSSRKTHSGPERRSRKQTWPLDSPERRHRANRRSGERRGTLGFPEALRGSPRASLAQKAPSQFIARTYRIQPEAIEPRATSRSSALRFAWKRHVNEGNRRRRRETTSVPSSCPCSPPPAGVRSSSR